MKNVTEVINLLPKIIIHDILLNRLTKKRNISSLDIHLFFSKFSKSDNRLFNVLLLYTERR